MSRRTAAWLAWSLAGLALATAVANVLLQVISEAAREEVSVGSAVGGAIAETTGLARGTVKNKITALKKAGRVEITGEIRSQMEQVRLVAPRHRPIKGSAASATPGTSTVAGLFADPPEWLPKQLKVYRENPERHFIPLCKAVAAVVLGDDARASEVQEEVKKALEEGTQG
jgi:hypothetical protein